MRSKPGILRELGFWGPPWNGGQVIHIMRRKVGSRDDVPGTGW